VVRQLILVQLIVGSNPTSPANLTNYNAISVEFNVQSEKIIELQERFV